MSDAAGWLENRDPGSLVTELKQFARQRPGTFLAAAAAIGVVGGRLSRGLVADHQDTNGSGSSTPVTGAGDYPSSVDHSTSGATRPMARPVVPRCRLLVQRQSRETRRRATPPSAVRTLCRQSTR